MAGETDSFTLEMKDAISGPAKEASKNLKTLKDAMAGVNATGKGDGMAKASKGMKSGGDDAASMAKSVKGAGKEAVAAGKAVAGAAGDFGKMALAAATGVGLVEAAVMAVTDLKEAASAALSAIGEWLEKGLEWGAEMAVEGQQFSRHMRDVFTVFTGTAEKGQETLDVVRAMSARVPITQKEAADSAQELLSLGIKGQNRLGNTVQAIGQMQAVMGDKASDKLNGIISTAQSSTNGGMWRGVFAPSRQDLREIGLSYDDLSKSLAQNLGKTTAETKRMLLYGQVSAQQGIDAIDKAISGGKIGKMAQDALLDPTLLFKQFKENISNLFTIDSPEAKEFMQEIRGFVLMLAPGSENAKTMGDSIKDMVKEGFRIGVPIIQDFELALIETEIAIIKTETALVPLEAALSDLADNKELMRGISISFDIMAAAVRPLGAGLKWTADEAARLINLFNDLDKIDQAARQYGKTGSYVGLAANTLPGHAEGGVVTGISDGLATVQPAPGEGLASIGKGETILRSPNIAPMGSGGGASTVVHVDFGGLHIGGHVKDAPEMMRIVEPAIKSIFERLSEELGGAAGVTG